MNDINSVSGIGSKLKMKGVLDLFEILISE